MSPCCMRIFELVCPHVALHILLLTRVGEAVTVVLSCMGRYRKTRLLTSKCSETLRDSQPVAQGACRRFWNRHCETIILLSLAGLRMTYGTAREDIYVHLCVSVLLKIWKENLQVPELLASWVNDAQQGHFPGQPGSTASVMLTRAWLQKWACESFRP